jgi:hypothetical protein
MSSQSSFEEKLRRVDELGHEILKLVMRRGALRTTLMQAEQPGTTPEQIQEASLDLEEVEQTLRKLEEQERALLDELMDECLDRDVQLRSLWAKKHEIVEELDRVWEAYADQRQMLRRMRDEHADAKLIAQVEAALRQDAQKRDGLQQQLGALVRELRKFGF